jgi:FtsZ-interacting cell division protein ZipA
MINGINSSLQSTIQSMLNVQETSSVRSERTETDRDRDNAKRSVVNAQSTQVSLQQPAPDKAVADYRQVAQKATLAMQQMNTVDPQQDQQMQLQKQIQVRNQAFLATAALKSY